MSLRLESTNIKKKGIGYISWRLGIYKWDYLPFLHFHLKLTYIRDSFGNRGCRNERQRKRLLWNPDLWYVPWWRHCLLVLGKEKVQSVTFRLKALTRWGTECTLSWRLKGWPSRSQKGRDTGSLKVENSARLANIKTSAPPAQEEMANFHFLWKINLFIDLSINNA